MKEIKFRIWIGGRFHYWGFLNDSFAGIPDDNSEPLTIEEKRARSQQFVGSEDKNRKEIYEGDIITDAYGHRHTVTFSHGCFTIDDEEPLAWDTETGDREAWTETEDWATVIGNIYENPELLEETKQ